MQTILTEHPHNVDELTIFDLDKLDVDLKRRIIKTIHVAHELSCECPTECHLYETINRLSNRVTQLNAEIEELKASQNNGL